MDDRRLSSAGTIAYKFLWPILCLPPFGAWAAIEVLEDIRNCLLSVVVFGAITLLYSVWYLPLKKVTATRDGLRVSNYWSTVTVPYEEIAQVREFKLLDIRPITVVLRHPCRFGRKIRFMPRGQFLLLFWRDHPVACWLRETCERKPHTEERVNSKSQDVEPG